jgi:transcriptional regulator with XRE-family HTH domain
LSAPSPHDARTIGARLRRIRRARGKSLRVIAGLTGMSATHLWRIEHGERALDLSEIAALADALQIAPSELIKLPIPAPANGNTDSAIKRDTPTALGLATWGGLHVMLIDGATDLALAELDATTVPANSPESMQLAGMLALSRSLVAAVDKRPADVEAPLELASELAERTGEVNAYWMGFGPTNVGCWRLAAAVEIGDHERAVAIAEGLHPQRHPHRGSQALYWVQYGRALSRVRGRRDDGVRALRRAELISPHQVQRDPLARDVVGELLARTHRDSPVRRELQRMAARAGLPM